MLCIISNHKLFKIGYSFNTARLWLSDFRFSRWWCSFTHRDMLPHRAPWDRTRHIIDLALKDGEHSALIDSVSDTIWDDASICWKYNNTILRFLIEHFPSCSVSCFVRASTKLIKANRENDISPAPGLLKENGFINFYLYPWQLFCAWKWFAVQCNVIEFMMLLHVYPVMLHLMRNSNWQQHMLSASLGIVHCPF